MCIFIYKSMLKEFKKPDVKAPRCRAGVHSILNKAFIDDFVSKYPQYAGITYFELLKIVKAFNKKLWEHAAVSRDGTELPEGLGYIFIGTCFSPKKFNNNYGESIKQDYRIRHRNFESDNYLCKIFYTNFSTKYKFKFRELWSFEPTRSFKRSVSKTYPENWKIYLQVEGNKHISKYIKKYFKKEYVKKVIENFVLDPNYNEFDLN